MYIYIYIHTYTHVKTNNVYIHTEPYYKHTVFEQSRVLSNCKSTNSNIIRKSNNLSSEIIVGEVVVKSPYDNHNTTNINTTSNNNQISTHNSNSDT